MNMRIEDADLRLKEIAAQKAALMREEKAINAEIMSRYEAEIAERYRAKDDPFGTVHIMNGLYDLEVNVPKKVTWDQVELQRIYRDIADGNENPDEYINVSFDVSETKYKAWPSFITEKFEPARTVSPGTPKLTIKKKEA